MEDSCDAPSANSGGGAGVGVADWERSEATSGASGRLSGFSPLVSSSVVLAGAGTSEFVTSDCETTVDKSSVTPSATSLIPSYFAACGSWNVPLHLNHTPWGVSFVTSFQRYMILIIHFLMLFFLIVFVLIVGVDDTTLSAEEEEVEEEMEEEEGGASEDEEGQQHHLLKVSKQWSSQSNNNHTLLRRTW